MVSFSQNIYVFSCYTKWFQFGGSKLFGFKKFIFGAGFYSNRNKIHVIFYLFGDNSMNDEKRQEMKMLFVKRVNLESWLETCSVGRQTSPDFARN